MANREASRRSWKAAIAAFGLASIAGVLLLRARTPEPAAPAARVAAAGSEDAPVFPRVPAPSPLAAAPEIESEPAPGPASSYEAPAVASPVPAAEARFAPPSTPASAAPPGPVPPGGVFPAFREWAERYAAAAAPAARAALLPEGERLAAARREALKSLVESDPERALAEALPVRLARSMPPSVARRLEERVSARGRFEVIASTRDEGPGGALSSSVERFVEAGGRRFRASVYGRRLSQTTRENIPLHGIALDGVLAVHQSPVRRLEPGERPDPAAPAGNPGGKCPVSGRPASHDHAADVGGEIYSFCHSGHLNEFEEGLLAAEGSTGTAGSGAPLAQSSWTEGPKTVLFIRVDFSDLTGEPISQASAQSLIDVDVNNFYQAASYGKTSMTATVTPVVRVPQTAVYYKSNSSALLSDARAAAKTAGFDYLTYDRDIVGFKNIGYSFAGMAYVGSRGVWINGSFSLRVVGHELGHNWGVYHANLWKTTDGTVIGAGANQEYGNPFDIMGGGGGTYSHFNAWFKSVFNWVVPSEVTTAASSGTYRVYALENAISSGSHAVKVVKDASTNYWVEFRQGNTGNKWLMAGASVNWGFNSNKGSQVLDMSPNSSGGTSDSPLVIGRTFSDATAGVHITPVAKGGTTPESLDVVVNLGAFAGNQPPTVAVSSSASSAALGATVSFTATASDPDGNPLAYYWDFGDGNFGTNSAGASKSWTIAGDYVVRCTVTDMRGGTGSAGVTVRVGSPTTYQIGGRVTENGAAVLGASVTDGTRTAWTDLAGNYLLTGVPAGSYTLAASKPGLSLVPDGFANPVAVGPSRASANFSTTGTPPPPPGAVDLVVDGVSPTVSGRTVAVTDAVRNAGTTGTTTTFYVRYYLSLDANITTSDVYLGQRSVAGLAGGATSTGSVSFTTSTSLVPGAYYVGVIADATGQVAESSEANNALSSSSAYAFRPDLVFSAFSAKVSSGKVSVSNTFKNQGTAASSAGGFSGTFYLSADALYDVSDVSIGSRTRTSALNVDSTNSDTTSYVVPAGTAAGDYFVVGRVDSGNAQVELSESNNVSASASRLAIRPDLYCSSLSASRSGTTLNVSDTVKNQGPLASGGSFRLDFYLSTDATITTSDTFIGSRTVSSSLAYAAGSSATTALAIPPSLAPGSYRVGVIVDAGGAIPEGLETNNTKYSSSLSLLPDLVAVSVSVSASGRTVTFTDTIRNDGPVAAQAPFTVDLKLSSDTSIGSGDPLLGTRTVPAGLAPGASSTATTILTAPSTVAAGSYYGGAWADSADALPELSSSNNKAASAAKVTIGP